MEDSRLRRALRRLTDALDTDDENYFYALVGDAKDELAEVLED